MIVQFIQTQTYQSRILKLTPFIKNIQFSLRILSNPNPFQVYIPTIIRKDPN